MGVLDIEQVDLGAWVAARVGIQNLSGGRGYASGVRVFDCPLCGDTKARAWINVVRGTAGCLNAGCLAERGLSAIDYVRRAEGLQSLAETKLLLLREFPRIGPIEGPPLQPATYADWCELPAGFQAIPRAWHRSPLLDEARAFAAQQWGITAYDLHRWGCGICARGRHAWRLVIPIMLDRQLVGFQARALRGNVEPKYRTSEYGARGTDGAECGRPADALLFNLDAVQEGDDVILVEGAGDAMAIARRVSESGSRHGGPGGTRSDPSIGSEVFSVPVALLGLALTDEKAALLAAKKPGRVIVATDAEPEAEARGRQIAEVLMLQWGFVTVLGRWVGAKDAGEGARLATTLPHRGLTSLVAARIRR